MQESQGKRGRKSKTVLTAQAEQIIIESVVAAVQYMRDVASGKQKPNRDRMKACMFLIEQALGRARQAVELSGAAGGPITLRVVEDGK